MFEIDDKPLNAEASESSGEMVPVYSVVPQVVRGINISRVSNRTELIREAIKVLPINDYGLPEYIYRTDLVSFVEAQREHLGDILENAIMPLEYHQGFPTLPNEQPFWAQLPFEDVEAFKAFVFYMSLEGGRTLERCAAYKQEDLGVWYHENYWAPRARAYDLFTAAHHMRMREHRIFKLNDKHYAEGEKIFNKVMNVLNGLTEEDLKSVEPDKLVTMATKIAGLQRQAAGVASLNADMTPKAPSVEVFMRDIAKQNVQPTLAEEDLDISKLLQDPQTADTLQELVIRVNK